MIIYENKGFEQRSDKPSEDWTGTAKHVVEDGTDLANKVILNAPYFTEVLDENGVLIDILPTERPTFPTEEPQPTETEILRADIEYLSAMTGVAL